jgi:hypothetical protein
VSNDCMRTLQRTAVVGVLLALLLVVALVTYSNRLKRSAEKVVLISYELSQRESPPTLEELRLRFGAQLKQFAACTPSGCGYEVRLSNRLLSDLRLARPTALRSSFWVRDNVLEENVLELWTVSRSGRMVLAYADVKYCEECGDFDVIPCEGTSTSVASGSVKIGSRSRFVDKQTTFAFNTECFVRLRGCATVAELLPTIWHTTSAGTLQCTSPGQQSKP